MIMKFEWFLMKNDSQTLLIFSLEWRFFFIYVIFVFLRVMTAIFSYKNYIFFSVFLCYISFVICFWHMKKADLWSHKISILPCLPVMYFLFLVFYFSFIFSILLAFNQWLQKKSAGTNEETFLKQEIYKYPKSFHFIIKFLFFAFKIQIILFLVFLIKKKSTNKNITFFSPFYVIFDENIKKKPIISKKYFFSFYKYRTQKNKYQYSEAQNILILIVAAVDYFTLLWQ